MNKVLKDILKSGKVGGAANERRVFAEIPADVGNFVTRIIQTIKPKISLEVGLAYGISALYICEALTEIGAVKHYLIDPNQASEWDNIGIDNLHAAGFRDKIELREQMSHVALPQLLSEGVKIDFAFIDGWHVFDQVLLDFFYIDKLLQLGGIIAFDDANWPGVRKALRFIVQNRRYDIVGCSPSPASKKDRIACSLQPMTRFLGAVLRPELSSPDGLLGLRAGSRCIAIRKLSEDDRNITFFRPF